jgi:predicted amidohydrolase
VPELSTTQCEYIMPVRAYENGVWVAASDKWGPEDGSIIYAGRSCVIDPSGAIRAAAPSDRDQVLVYDIEPTNPEPITRRPALYGRLAEPTASLPVSSLLDEAMTPARENRRVTVVPGNGAFDAATMAARYRALRKQDADLVVFGGAQGPEGWEVDLPTLERAVRETGGALAFAVSTNGCMWGESAMLITPEGAFEHTATHGRGIATGELTAKVVPTAAGNVGILCGNEGLVPEVARALMLEGADILAWSMFEADPMAERVARARGDENRVYVAAAWPDGGVIVAPTGAALTAVPASTGVAMTAPVNKALARIKDMAPGTNAVHDRIPEAYGALVR